MRYVTLTFPEEALTRAYLSRFREAEEALLAAAVTDTEPYVPYDTGRLCGSVRSDISGDGTAGQICYLTPYARTVYNGRGKRFRTEHHPLASAEWFACAKRVCLPSWTEKVKARLHK